MRLSCATGVCRGKLESHAGDEPDAHKQFTDYLMETYGTGQSRLGFGTSRIEEPRVVTFSSPTSWVRPSEQPRWVIAAGTR